MTRLSSIPAEDAYERWAALAALGTDERRAGIGGWLAAVAGLPADERAGEIEAVLQAEAKVSDGAMLALTGDRLLALTDLPADEAAGLMTMFQEAEQRQPAAVVMRRVSALQGACKELTLEEISKVQAFLPSAPELAGLPPARKSRTEAADLTVITPSPKRKSLWRLFGRA
jgi:hypothetical protein